MPTPVLSRLKLIVVYYEGVPTAELQDGPEVPDSNDYNYPGLLSFTNQLPPGPSVFKNIICGRNPDVLDIRYVPVNYREDPPAVDQHIFELEIYAGPDDLIWFPMINAPQEDPENSGIYSWSVNGNYQFANAIYALLDRIFWRPPTPPRISGFFVVENILIVTDDNMEKDLIWVRARSWGGS